MRNAHGLAPGPDAVSANHLSLDHASSKEAMKRTLLLSIAVSLLLPQALPTAAQAADISHAEALPAVALTADDALRAVRSATADAFEHSPEAGRGYVTMIEGSHDWTTPTAAQVAAADLALPVREPGEARFVAIAHDVPVVLDVARLSDGSVMEIFVASDSEATGDYARVLRVVTQAAGNVVHVYSAVGGSAPVHASMERSEPLECTVGSNCGAGAGFAVGTAGGAVCSALGAAGAFPTLGFSAFVAAFGCGFVASLLGVGTDYLCSASGDVTCTQSVDGNLHTIRQGSCAAFNICNFKGTVTTKSTLSSVEGLYIYQINGYTSFEVRNISSGYRNYRLSNRLVTGERVYETDLGFGPDASTRREHCSRGITIDAYAIIQSGRDPRATLTTGKEGGNNSEGACGRA